MKGTKISALILAAVLGTTALTACSNGKKPVSSDVSIIASQGQGGFNGDSRFVADPDAESKNYFFKHNDVNVVIGIPIKKVLPGLGNNYTVVPAANCAGQGTAYNYTFNGGSFTIETTPYNGEDYITGIALGNDSVSTAEGVCIGNTIDQVKTTYGEANPEDSTDDTWVYDKGSSRISIGFTDQKVSSIYYQAKM